MPLAKKFTFYLLSLLLACAIAQTLLAQATAASDSCPVKPHPAWSAVETRVWGQLCMGRFATFDTRTLPPSSADGWGDSRLLSPEFLERILLHEPWASTLPRQGVRILGALFKRSVDLEGAKLQHPVLLNGSRLERGIFLPRAQSQNLVSLDRSYVERLNMESARLEELSLLEVTFGDASDGQVFLRGVDVHRNVIIDNARVPLPVNMNSAVVGANVYMRGSTLNEINLRSVKVGGQVSFVGSKVAKALEMDEVIVTGSVQLGGKAEFANVSLRGALVNGQVSFLDAKVSGMLVLDEATIERNLSLERGTFADVTLQNTRIDDVLGLFSTTVSGVLDMRGTEVRRNLEMRSANVSGDVVAPWIQVSGDLNLSSATLSNVNLRGAQIRGDLVLGHSDESGPTWRDGAVLILRNASVDGLQDTATATAWPKRVDLKGFVYHQLTTDTEARGADWYANWLARDETYSPQPYRQLAAVLQDMGYGNEANEVLWEGRERRRARADWVTWIGQTVFLKWMIGYGIGSGYLRALWWVVGLVGIGYTVLWWSGQHKLLTTSPPQRFVHHMDIVFYSLDKLLPIIELRHKHAEIDLQGCVRYWFYLHRIMGYILVSCVIAGFAGLTQ